MKKSNLWILLIVLLATSILFLTGCGGADEGPPKVAVVTPFMANETTKYVIDQFKAEAEAKGWEVTVTDTAGDFNLLVSRIDDAVTQDVDAIVLGMGDPAQMTKGLEAAQEAGIPVFGLDAGIAPGVLVNVTSDNSALGKTSADALAEAIGGEGNVIMLTHDPHPGVNERAAAAAEAFATYPGITVVEKMHIDVPGPLENGRTIMEDLLNAYPETGDIAGIWAGWDEPAMGAYQAIQEVGREEILIIGIDGTDFARAEIAKDGSFIGSVAQDFDSMASELAELIGANFDGEAPSQEWHKIPGTLVTAENANE